MSEILGILGNPWVWLILFVAAFIIGGVWAVKRGKAAQENGNHVQVNVGVVAVVAAVVAVLFQLPSLSIDINGIFTYAFDVVNAFMPLIAIIAGLGLGFNLITKISGLFNRAL